MEALLEVELLHPGTVSQAEAGEVREVRERPGRQQRLVGGLQGQQLVQGHLPGLQGRQDVLHRLDGGGGGGGGGLPVPVLHDGAGGVSLLATGGTAGDVRLTRTVGRAGGVVPTTSHRHISHHIISHHTSHHITSVAHNISHHITPHRQKQ